MEEAWVLGVFNKEHLVQKGLLGGGGLLFQGTLSSDPHWLP